MLSTNISSTSITDSVPTFTSSAAATTPSHNVYNTALLAIYTVVLVTGTISLSLMMHILKSSSTSSTSIAVLNLIFAHFVFLITVPFRIYYYVAQNWNLGYEWCKVVSGMIHVHMYMSFVFYVIILITRLATFYYHTGGLASFQRMHAFLVSAAVWAVVLVLTPCIIHFSYGKNSPQNGTVCFQFGESITGGPAKVFNYIISTLIILVATVLTVLQANVLRVLYRKHQGCTSQQEFGAQLKSLCFALIMVVCFIPYHMFRLYYLENIRSLEDTNEVFLSLTTFNCLDMLTFMGRRTWYTCFLGKICV